MSALIRVEIVKIMRRRAMLLTCAGVALAAIVGLFVIAYVLHVQDEAANPSVGGGSGMDATAAVLAGLTLVIGSLIGARAGAFDQETRVIRYWAMLGTSRTALVGVRLPAACAVAVVALLPALVVGAGASAVLPAEAGDGLSAADIGSATWSVLLAAVLWTGLGVGIGALFGSTGAGIAVALAVSLIGAPALSALQLLWSPLAAIPLSNAQFVLEGSGGDGPVWVALLVALLWVGAPMVGAAMRLRRAEL